MVSPGFAVKETVTINNQTIEILPLPYFLATKFSAFNNRGNNEPRTSPDFEDIGYIFDNRIDLVEQLLYAPEDVKSFLKNELKIILSDNKKQEAILGNLFYAVRNERFNIIFKKLNQIANIN